MYAAREYCFAFKERTGNGQVNPQNQHQQREQRNEIVIITDGRWKKPLDS